MSLHYLVKLEMFVTLVLPLHCQRKKLQNLSHLIWPPNSDELKQRLKTEWTKLDDVVIAAAIRQWRRR